MAGKNTFDLNDPRAAYANRTDLSDEEISAGLDSLWENFCVSSNYELGSVIKPIIVASALESGAGMALIFIMHISRIMQKISRSEKK